RLRPREGCKRRAVVGTTIYEGPVECGTSGSLVEPGSGTVEVVGSTLGGDVDGAAGGVSVAGVGAEDVDTNFVDGIEGRAEAGGAAGVLHVVDAIEQKLV